MEQKKKLEAAVDTVFMQLGLDAFTPAGEVRKLGPGGRTEPEAAHGLG